ncbi:hypothetical protein [Paenibacillus eucommiae]|uniref:ASCH domain-containing protein n=1 Tax=Paenibacillus eucommiae TaxID=1355755 RepID=A0ABS4JBS5_9BACL|nr:hypothetical protein [Paenibacillus eucommiae]MBP1996670.1 hypothetical protein [Paenibacillus eucommiae]
MLFKNHILDGIAKGEISLAFRRWKSARVNSGSRLHTTIGVLEIVSIEAIHDWEISDEDIKQAGFSTREGLLKEINSFSNDGNIYRIVLVHIGADPREELRERNELTEQEFVEVRGKLERLDKASPHGPWTAKFMCIIKQYPGLRSTELASAIEWETEKFKLNVRKLKNIGLTISLGTGYQISPRGEVVMERLELK